VSPVEGSGAEDAAKRESDSVSDTNSRGSATIPYSAGGKAVCVRQEGIHLQCEQRQEVQRRLEREQSVG
jgi:hypothetical protein